VLVQLPRVVLPRQPQLLCHVGLTGSGLAHRRATNRLGWRPRSPRAR
jgi:hypothetical protein